jgi:hypothetical protein
VLEASEEQREAAAGRLPKTALAGVKELFSREELNSYFTKNFEALKRAGEKSMQLRPEMTGHLEEIADSLKASATVLDSPGPLELEDLERRLTVLDEKLHAVLTTYATEDVLVRIRREVDGQLSMYRRKMKAAQLALVEKQYIHKRLLEEFGLPRLSLYYLS